MGDYFILLEATKQLLLQIDTGAYRSKIDLINDILDASVKNDQYKFYELINSTSFWGGAGSLADSQYGMSEEVQDSLQKYLFEILLLLEAEKKIQKPALRVLKSYKR